MEKITFEDLRGFQNVLTMAQKLNLIKEEEAIELWDKIFDVVEIAIKGKIKGGDEEK